MKFDQERINKIRGAVMSSIRSDEQAPPIVILEGDVEVTLDAAFKVRSIKLGKGASPRLEQAVTNAMNRALQALTQQHATRLEQAIADGRS